MLLVYYLLQIQGCTLEYTRLLHMYIAILHGSTRVLGGRLIHLVLAQASVFDEMRWFACFST